MAGAVRRAAGHRGTSAYLLALAIGALALGGLVYLLDRGPGSAALLPWGGLQSDAPLLGAVGGWLPSFTHAFAFALLTAATARPASAPPYWACLLWWVINVAFECMQAPAWKGVVADSVQRWLGDGALPVLFARYVARGTFDLADLAAVTAGALAAAAVLSAHWHTEDHHGR